MVKLPPVNRGAHMRAGLVFLVLAAVGFSSVANAQKKLSLSDYLAGSDTIDVAVSVSQDPDNGTCGRDNNSIRSHIINKIVPAGLKTDTKSARTFSFNIYGLYLSHYSLCVTTVDYAFYYYADYSAPGGTEQFGPVEIVNSGRIFSSVASEHRARIKSVVEDFSDRILAAWREANPAMARSQAPQVSTPAPAAPKPSASGPALTESSVRDIQRRLRGLGHYNGQIDGQLGVGTRTALGQFQRASGLPVTNQADWTTLERLYQ